MVRTIRWSRNSTPSVYAQPASCGQVGRLVPRRRCYDPAVDADDILAFARRDWNAVAESKAAFWAERKRVMTPDEALAVAEGLRRHARALRPDWPDIHERDDDLAVHARVAEALRAVSAIRSR
jgi:hypothetical protein